LTKQSFFSIIKVLILEVLMNVNLIEIEDILLKKMILRENEI
jgi:hypothetical protein